ncbi:hypothetical protein F2Q70_00007466 [Brassica cretica]|uniref:Uncharacterized protein n=1 Tax=Brassica cretica TaxID=69181 RepID=A0A8S9MD81_BRACR|nr:hypothetical protein F2Q70_00007466 [Brassica cretica]
MQTSCYKCKMMWQMIFGLPAFVNLSIYYYKEELFSSPMLPGHQFMVHHVVGALIRSTDYGVPGVLCYMNCHEETLDRTLFVTFSFEVPLLQTVTDALIDGLNSFSPLLPRFLIQCTSLPVGQSFAIKRVANSYFFLIDLKSGSCITTVQGRLGGQESEKRLRAYGCVVCFSLMPM